MNPEEIIQYLKNNPEFFEKYAEEISRWVIPHPYGGRTISITERQILSLREQNKRLEATVNDMIHFGEENDTSSEKIHRLGVSLIAVTSFASLVEILNFHFVEYFSIPYVALRLWLPPEDLPDTGEFKPLGNEFRASIDGLSLPYCGLVSDFAWGECRDETLTALFGDKAAQLTSQGIIALRNGGGTIGVIVLGSADPQRFYADMGTIYLERLGEMVSATLARILYFKRQTQSAQ